MNVALCGEVSDNCTNYMLVLELHVAWVYWNIYLWGGVVGREDALEWGLEPKCCHRGGRRRESCKLAAIFQFKKRSGNVLMPNYATPFSPVSLLSLVFHLIDWKFSYSCYQLWKLGWLTAFLFCSVLAWQTPAYATASTFNNTSITASVLKKPADFLAPTRPGRTCCSAGMWQEAIYKELTLTVTLYSWFSKIQALKMC